jgi:nitrogen regulatory protein P-II 1
LPKIKLELFVKSSLLEAAISAISSAAATGKIGDGKIFVSEVAEAIRIRNGDRGELVL